MLQSVHDMAGQFVRYAMGAERFVGIRDAHQFMLEQWRQKDAAIPSWLNRDDVGLDLMYTTRDTAEFCVDDIQTTPKDCTFIEPSAGTGSFVNALPTGTIAMDVLPRHRRVKQGEFLTWEPPASDKPYTVVGAPPFGNKLWHTNAFTLHALDVADCVGFICDTRALREMPNGRLHHTVSLRKGAMHTLSDTMPNRPLEWRVWVK